MARKAKAKKAKWDTCEPGECSKCDVYDECPKIEETHQAITDSLEIVDVPTFLTILAEALENSNNGNDGDDGDDDE